MDPLIKVANINSMLTLIALQYMWLLYWTIHHPPSR